MAEIKGVREYLQSAKAAVYAGVDAVVTVNQAQANLVFERSQGLVPVESGRLKASGKVRTTKTGATITYDAPYAAKVEFSSKINRKNGQQFFLHQPMTEQVDATGTKWQSAFLGAIQGQAKEG